MCNNLDINSASEKVCEILRLCRSSLSENVVNEIARYLEHREPEIAFEGLFIELLQSGTLPEALDRASCIDLGRCLGLDNETVLDDDFWEKFVVFLQSK